MNINLKNTLVSLGIFALTTPMMAGAVIKTESVNEDKAVILYSAHEMNSEAGRSQIERQVRDAARKICGPVNIQAGTIRQRVANKACYDEAVGNALDGVLGSTAD